MRHVISRCCTDFIFFPIHEIIVWSLLLDLFHGCFFWIWVCFLQCILFTQGCVISYLVTVSFALWNPITMSTSVMIKVFLCVTAAFGQDVFLGRGAETCENFGCADGWVEAIPGLQADCQDDAGGSRYDEADVVHLTGISSTAECGGQCGNRGATSYGWCGGFNCYGNCNCYFHFKSSTKDHGTAHYACDTCCNIKWCSKFELYHLRHQICCSFTNG